MSESDDKKKLAEQIERFGDAHRAEMVGFLQQSLRTLAKAADHIADQYAGSEWTAAWVMLVTRAAADLRSAADRVKIPPYAPHGEVPS